ncbi:MAG: carbon-nitrogen hydrolase family protein [Anaerolineae bacterium]|nr:carbon-nitrogen hydrolase family protein [Anaerolineae bacterium]MCO5207943.1 carbon-nitrogen hydrolase family protein [Anaerolineae bacterium]
MRVTVCELHNDSAEFDHDWHALVDYVATEQSDLVLLPEMPFAPWVAWTRIVDSAVWAAAVAAHDAWIDRLDALAPATVMGSRPVVTIGKRHNEGFVWDNAGGYRLLHTKYYLPDEERFWEATWYERGPKQFMPIRTTHATVGALICTEMWFTEHARAYARQGVEVLAVPRATELFSAEKWIAGGRVAAVMSGAFCLSSNRGGVDATGIQWGGHGWIIDPDGDVLGLTSPENPFLTCDIDLSAAAVAKQTYPRYVAE